MIIQTRRKNKLVIRPRSGGLQGDVAMPPQFGALYDPEIAGGMDSGEAA